MRNFSTSGTTGRKSFGISSEKLAARILRRGDTKGPDFDKLENFYCDYGPNSTSATTYQQYFEGKGARYFGFMGSPEACVNLILRERPEGIAANPGRLVMFARMLRGAHRFKHILAGGMPCRAGQSREIRAGLGDNLFCTYSASEIGPIAIATAEQVEAIKGCVGRPFDDLIVEIDEGQVRVRPRTGDVGMIEGYENAGQTAQFFKTRAGDRWFYPGDLGEITGDGLLVIKGRVRAPA